MRVSNQVSCFVGRFVLALPLVNAAAHAQLLKSSTPLLASGSSGIEQQILAGSVVPAPAITLNPRPGGPDDANIAVLRQQSSTLHGLAGVPAVSLVQPERTMALTPADMTRVPQSPSGVLQRPCPSPSITAVDNQPAGIDFSPTEPYNSYVIQGCFPGDVPKAVYLQAAQSFFPKSTGQIALTAPMPIKLGVPTCNLASSSRMDLVIDFPSPNPTHHPTPADPQKEIDVHVPPCISGVLDQWGNSVTLVVEFANGQKAQRGGFNFFAARDTVYLQTIPRSALSESPGQIIPISEDSGTVFKYVSPVPKYSAAFIRHAQTFRFSPIRDVFNLNGLQLGFAVTEPQLYPLPMTKQACTTALKNPFAQVQTQGSWGIQWGNDPLVFSVSTQLTYCQPTNAFSAPTGAPSLFDETYLIKVPVKGPRGVAPWANGSY